MNPRILISCALLNTSLMAHALEGNNIPDACGTAMALSTCLEPVTGGDGKDNDTNLDPYVAASVRYFLTMKSNQDPHEAIAIESNEMIADYLRPLSKGEWNPVNKWFRKKTLHPKYAKNVIRYEFPPWLLTTGFGVVTMKNVDELLRLYKTDYKSIDCRAFDIQPFGRCRAIFLYGNDDPETAEDERTECPIYEEFTFNESGEITFIEAWTDHPGYRPMADDDHWGEDEGVQRLSTKVPGLGFRKGLIPLDSDYLNQAATIFDQQFKAPFWDETKHPSGPFHGMIHDLQGRLNGWSIPPRFLTSFWPSWMQRTLGHLEGNILDGCLPPIKIISK